MTIKIVNDDPYYLVMGHRIEKGYPRLEKRSRYTKRTHPKDWNTFARFCTTDRHSLGKASCSDTLKSLCILPGTKYVTLTCQNTETGETFPINVSFVSLSYEVIIANYDHFAGFSSHKMTTKGYTYSDVVSDQMAFTVRDIFLYYYHNNKDTENHGFDTSINPKEVTAMWDVIQRGALYDISTNKIPVVPFALGDVMVTENDPRRTHMLLWNIKDNHVKWDDKHFFSGIVMSGMTHFKHPSSAQNLAALYVIGDNLKMDDPKLIVFDEPKSLLDVINDHEFPKDVRNILNHINKKLKPSETELLETTYKPFALPKRFFTKLDCECKNKFELMDESINDISIRESLSCTDKEYSKMMSYPLFAFRNIYVQDWIPICNVKYNGYYYSNNSSLDILQMIVDDKVKQMKSEKMKLAQERKGGYIDPNSDTKYDYLDSFISRETNYPFGHKKALQRREDKKRRNSVKKSVCNTEE